jgi:putative ABC transport system permease protein
VLVRPRGSRSEIERRTGQAPPNFLSELSEGITHVQWRRIQRLPGVEVAAPIANVGYVFPTVSVPVDISAAARTHGRVLLRARVAWRSEAGLTRAADRPNYAYVTPNRLRGEPGWRHEELGFYRRYSLREDIPGRSRPAPVCTSIWVQQPETVISGPFASRWRSSVGCFSRRTGTGRIDWGPLRRSPPRVELRWAFPMLLTAIDSESEARLTGLDRTVVGGRYLRRGDRARLTREPRSREDFVPRILPVLAASRTYVDEQAELAVERLGAAAADRWARPFQTHCDVDTLVPLRFLTRRPHGPVVQRARVSAATAYRQLLHDLQLTLTYREA